LENFRVSGDYKAVHLEKYNNNNFCRGRSFITELLWMIFNVLFVQSAIPGSFHRIYLLRMFGAKLAQGVVIKPGVRIKFPWRLKVGADSWIGEGVWIDNLDEVVIGSNCCISQGVYLCTGSHNWSAETFDLITKPIHIKDSAWLCAKSVVGPGVTVGEGAVLTLGGVANHDLDAWKVYAGMPAVAIKDRVIQPE